MIWRVLSGPELHNFDQLGTAGTCLLIMQEWCGESTGEGLYSAESLLKICVVLACFQTHGFRSAPDHQVDAYNYHDSSNTAASKQKNNVRACKPLLCETLCCP